MQGTKEGTCKKCGGLGKVKQSGKEVTCQACRGSGKSADYTVK